MAEIHTSVTPAVLDNNRTASQKNTTETTSPSDPPSQSIWSKYVEVADEWDRGTMKRWETNMNNLLIFAALFTAIITAFILDALPDLKNLSTSNKPSVILTVTALWFVSIMSSLAATTWAIICLEWCSFLTHVPKAGSHEEMAEKRQHKIEAIKRWKVGLIMAAIPLLLHFSLFSFLAGLWLRLRDINKEIGLIVGVPSLVMVSTYMVIAFLPIFTDAPFSTSASEVIEPVVDGIKYLIERSRFIRPPRLFAWILGSVFKWFSILFQALIQIARSPLIPHLWSTIFSPVRSAWRKSVSYVYIARRTVTWLLPFIFPTYAPDPYLFNELKKLKFGRADSKQQIHLRALFWLMNTPLDREEVKYVLDEFRVRHETADWGSLDHSSIKLLVSSISHLLKDSDISQDEEPIFRHCTAVLAEEIEKVWGSCGDFRGVYFWKSIPVLRRLLPHFGLDDPPSVPLTPSGGDNAHPRSTTMVCWPRKAVPALLFCPLPETVKSVAGLLDSTELLPKEDLLRIVHGLYAATLACSDSGQSIIEEIPDVGIWSWDSSTLDQHLDGALLQFLQNLFATLPRNDHSATIPSLITSCLDVLDGQRDRYSTKVHSALCLLVAVVCRTNPLVFEGESSSFGDNLLRSAESYGECRGEDDLENARRVVARLRAIACGPKPLICKDDTRPLARLGLLYSRLRESIKADKQCMKGLLDAYAASLEAVLSMDGPGTPAAQRAANRRVAGENLLKNTFFTLHDPFEFVRRNPSCRLQYLYSIAVALACAPEGWNEGLFKVTELLLDREEDGVAPGRVLDTNILVISLLGFAASSQPEPTRDKLGGDFIERLKGAIRDDTDSETRWKSIYFIADVTLLLSKIGLLGEAEEQFLAQAGSKALKQVKSQRVPSDWWKKEKGLRRCGLLDQVELLIHERGEAREGVYEWIGRHEVPYLSLYHPPPTTPQPIVYAKHWALSLAAIAYQTPNIHEQPADPMGNTPSTPEQEV